MTRDHVRGFIAREIDRRQSNKVLHGHPGPLHWTPLEESTESLLEKRRDYSHGPVNLYVGAPFCIKTAPDRCGFCLFPSEDYTGKRQVDEYLGYLGHEFRLLDSYYRNDTLGSIYFGGGTPNLYRPEQYHTLMSYVDRLYGGVPRDIEITLEGIPQLYTDEKVRAMSEAGINRISMGVQQIGDRLIRHSGRRQTRAHVMHAIELCQRYDMAHSIDLIYGWPEQTEEDMLADLQDVVDARVPHLTHYELNIAGRSAFARKAMRDLLPSLEDNRRLYHRSRQFLLEAGYEQVTVYDWRLVPEDAESARLGGYDYESSMHRFDNPEADDLSSTRQVCGIGYAAISCHVNGMEADVESWMFMNTRSSAEYRRQLDAGCLPTERGFKFSPDDIRIGWLFQTMQTMRIDTHRYQELFGHDIREPLGHFIDEAEERGWLECGDGELRFVGDGQCHIPMLQSLIASKRIAEITASRASGSGLTGIPVVQHVD